MVNPRKPPFLASRNAGWWAGTCIIAAAGRSPYRAAVRAGMKAVEFEPESDKILRGCAGSMVVSLAMWILIAFLLIRAFL
jgi:hypothetical protein